MERELPTADLITAMQHELRTYVAEFVRRMRVMRENGVPESTLEMILARNAADTADRAIAALAWAHIPNEETP